MAKGFTVGTNGQKNWFGQDLSDILNETTPGQAEAIAEQLAKITRSQSRERHPINIGLPMQG